MSDQQYDNTDKGALFRNNRKEKDTHPDFQGNLNVGGVEYWISGWAKESRKDGSQFLSLSIKKKEPKPAADTSSMFNPTPVGGSSAVAPFDDKIPFGPRSSDD